MTNVRSKWMIGLVLVIAASLALLTLGAMQSQVELPEDDEFQITLVSRIILPVPGIDLDFLNSLTESLISGEPVHIYVQLTRHLDEEERAALEEQGIILLSYIGSYAWRATVFGIEALSFSFTDIIDLPGILSAIRWIGKIQPVDRVNPVITAEGVSEHSRAAGDYVYLLVKFYGDVSLDDAAFEIEQAGGNVIGEIPILNTLQVLGPEEMVETLSGSEIVQWIDELPPQGEEDNDELRGAINVDALQVAPYNLDGTNVTFGQWEPSNVDASHDDFGSRVVIGDPPVSIGDHATHVCGTLLGDGTRSIAEGGTALQWRGVATNAHLVSFRRHKVSGALDVATTATQYSTAIGAPHDIEISTNSWGTSHYHTGGHYDVGCEFYDAVIHGSLDRPIPIVASAGNQGPVKSTELWRTVRIPNSAKNTIVVGAVFSDRDEIAWFSSTGPTEDGRLKPDVVAPGRQISSCIPTDSYGEKSGTSMSTPAVAGVIALMLQQYRITYFGDATADGAPLPSTYKAILCHTATDMITDPEYHPGVNFVGPDYVYGYGRVEAREAVDAIIEKRFLEGVLLKPVDEDVYTFVVPAGASELKVTLAWDDEAASPSDALIDILKNDLDLLVISPDGTKFYPPWELDPTNPATPAVRASYVSAAAALAHRDDVNVVEQVAIANPTGGIWTVKVAASDLPYPRQRYSLISDHVLEGNVDIVLVLDRSGSMSGKSSASEPETKIEVLKDAVDQFIEMMKPDIGNRLGLVQFNHDIVSFAPTYDTSLREITSGATGSAVELTGAAGSMIAGGATSIGDGLREALNQLTALGSPNPDQVILVISDGHENTDEMIAPVQPDLIASQVAVYSLGLGYSSGIDETKLTDLAEDTGGSYRITSEGLIFRKFFLEILASAVDWSVITDPIEELSAGETIFIPVPITDESSVTFTAYWEGLDDAIVLELVTPSGETITPLTSNGSIRYVDHPRYAFYQLDFPLDNGLAGEWSGVWQMKVTGTGNIPNGEVVRFSASAFSEGGSELEVDFDTLSHLTGDWVHVTARLTRNGSLVPGARIRVFADIPRAGIGNVLHEYRDTPVAASFDVDSSGGDVFDPIGSKLQWLSQLIGREILERGSSSFTLFDDGLHGDGDWKDGIYGGTFYNTLIPGSYTFRFVASSIPVGKGLTTTREWTESFHSEVDVDSESTLFEGCYLGTVGAGLTYTVQATPMDRFGNYLGPGHQLRMTATSPEGARVVDLADNVDGVYSVDMLFSPDECRALVEFVIELDGQHLKTVFARPCCWGGT